MNDKIKVKYDGRYLQAYMPNGDVIPLQTDIKVENEVGQENEATVTIQCIGDISDLKEMDKSDIDYKKSADYFQGQNTELKEQLDQAYKNAKFWEIEYHKENNKPSYKGMFYTFLILFLFVSMMLYFKL